MEMPGTGPNRPRALERAEDIARSALVWGGMAALTLVAVPPMLLGYPLVAADPDRTLSDRYLHALGRALILVNPRWRVRVEGAEALRGRGAFVFVANHQSLIDLVLMCLLGRPMKYLGKASVFRVPVFGWALRIAGEVPVERGNRESGAQALDELKRWLSRGVSVCLFPEGTRSDDDEIGPFRKGAFRLAIETQRSIVPVVISGARDVLPKGSLVFARSADVRVQVLEPVDTAGLTSRDTDALAERVRGAMVEAYRRA